MDKHIDILKQLYKYYWNKEQKIYNMLKTFDSISEKYKQCLYEFRIYDYLKNK